MEDTTSEPLLHCRTFSQGFRRCQIVVAQFLGVETEPDEDISMWDARRVTLAWRLSGKQSKFLTPFIAELGTVEEDIETDGAPGDPVTEALQLWKPSVPKMAWNIMAKAPLALLAWKRIVKAPSVPAERSESQPSLVPDRISATVVKEVSGAHDCSMVSVK